MVKHLAPLMTHPLFSDAYQGMGAANPSFTDEWLVANGHTREWLQKWFASYETDAFAIKEWTANHKNADPRLNISSRKWV